MALSLCETEYISLTLTACQGVWFADFITKLTRECVKAIQIFIDKKSAIDLAKNPLLHNHSKHIKIHYHYVRSCGEDE